MNNYKFEGLGEFYAPFEGSPPVAATIFVQDELGDNYSLRVETNAYHLFVNDLESGENPDGIVGEAEPVFVINNQDGLGVNVDLVNKILTSGLADSYLVKQNFEDNNKSPDLGDYSNS